MGHRFVPLLLSKTQEVLPRLASPMLQNAPENANICNVDIFDGLGNAGMAQPPMPVDDYETKYPMTRMEDVNTDAASSVAGGPSTNDMNSPFASSPAILSPVIEFPHHIKTEFHTMGDMVMSPVGRTPGGMNHQQPQHHPMSGFQNMTSQMQNGINADIPQATMNSQGLNRASSVNHGMQGMRNMPGQDMNGNMIGGGRPQQRANSFAMPPHQIRTVGDFHALQRHNPDMSSMHNMGLNNMATEMTFNRLP